MYYRLSRHEDEMSPKNKAFLFFFFFSFFLFFFRLCAPIIYIKSQESRVNSKTMKLKQKKIKDEKIKKIKR